ncbi:thiolase family protein [Bifidobacterium aquikefiricola]|uniref:Probable acetyl-CoA acetyltransferase n=1 Tax=Bifidobacterium aquikefiricola TaxID=3059038 RepID=A0AB39U5J6_9BIFI
MDKVVVVAAVRTPFGKYRGALKEYSATDLARHALVAAMERSAVPKASVEGLYLGVAVGAGLGPNVARTVAVSAGMPIESHAVTVNEVCGSSLKALRMAQLSIMAGDAQMLAVGGVESMTRAPMIIPDDIDQDAEDAEQSSAEDTEQGSAGEPEQPVKAIFKDGLIDSFSALPMGITAEHIADAYSVSRHMQDAFAYDSHRKALRAVSQHHFDDEIVPLAGLSHDETIRPDTSLLKLASLKPVYREHGSVTAGNAAPLSDGAAMLIIATERKAKSLGLKPLGYLGSYAEVGYDPAYMGYAPSIAIENLLKRSGTKVSDYDLYEITEAFAAQVIAVRDSLHIPDDRLNINGGSLALGHPLGASGARLVMALLNNLASRKLHSGIAALCIGGGQGIAMEIFQEDQTA